MSGYVEDCGHTSRHSSEFDCHCNSSAGHISNNVSDIEYGYHNSSCDRPKSTGYGYCTSSIGNYHNYFGLGYSIPFFINERKAHYAQLDRYVFRPLAGMPLMISQRRAFETLPLSPHLSEPTNSIHYSHARLHMEKNKRARNVPTQIGELIGNLDTYNNDVQTFYTLVNLTIDRLTSIPGVQVSFENIHTMVVSCWNQIIQDPSNNDIVTLRARLIDLTNNRTRYNVNINRENNLFRLNDLLIGEGQPNDLARLEQIIRENIIINNILLSNLLGLLGTRTILMNIINEISDTSREISDTIQAGTFRKARCCPTIFTLFDKYIL
jgi:hypothetical protein